MSKKQLFGFLISREEKKKINEWIRNHENKIHGGYPVYHGKIGGGYFYEFCPTSIGVAGSIVCSKCYTEKITKAKGNINRYKKMMRRCGGFYAFRRLGQ